MEKQINDKEVEQVGKFGPVENMKFKFLPGDPFVTYKFEKLTLFL